MRTKSGQMSTYFSFVLSFFDINPPTSEESSLPVD